VPTFDPTRTRVRCGANLCIPFPLHQRLAVRGKPTSDPTSASALVPRTLDATGDRGTISDWSRLTDLMACSKGHAKRSYRPGSVLLKTQIAAGMEPGALGETHQARSSATNSVGLDSRTLPTLQGRRAGRLPPTPPGKRPRRRGILFLLIRKMGKVNFAPGFASERPVLVFCLDRDPNPPGILFSFVIQSVPAFFDTDWPDDCRDIAQHFACILAHGIAAS